MASYELPDAEHLQPPPFRLYVPPEATYDSDITLRRGESVAFLWDHLDGQYNVRHLEAGEPPRKDTAPLDLPPPHSKARPRRPRGSSCGIRWCEGSDR